MGKAITITLFLIITVISLFVLASSLQMHQEAKEDCEKTRQDFIEQYGKLPAGMENACQEDLLGVKP